MKKMYLLMTMLLASLQLMAIPAKPVKTSLTLPDGSVVTATLRGDEHFHYYTTEDGRTLMLMDNGTFGFTDENTITRIWSERIATKQALRAKGSQVRRAMSSKPRREFGVPGKVVGQKKGLVILVNFKDKKLTHTQEEFYNQFNQQGYSKNRHIGSVRDYFLAQSYGQLIIDFDVVGPVTVTYNMSYYGANNSNGDDVRPEEMIIDACKKANSLVNFADYDWDGDGAVDQVYVVYAGYGEAQGASTNTIWPHEWELSSAGKSLKLDNTTIDTYACSSELSGTSGTLMDGIGSACHEFTHCLGIPDMYDIAYRNFGMGEWDVMDRGSYNGPSGYEGSVPAGYTAYERWFSGWLEPTVLDDGANITAMPAITDAPTCYVIYNQRNNNEYYLLQNIQQNSWNAYAGGHGLIVQHIYYDKDIWQANEVNCTSGTSGNTYQRCTIIPADNSLSSSSLSGDPFPGTRRKVSLTDNTSPAATLYQANSDGRKYLGRPIEEITEANGLISFTFNGGIQLETPVAHIVSDEAKGTGWFRASWNEVENAVSYNVEVTEYVEPKEEEENTDPQDVVLLLSEDFSGLAKYRGTLAIDSKLDQYLQTAGWTGTKVYTGTDNSGTNGIKLGSSSASGTLTTPLLSAPTTGTVSVLITAARYGNDALSLQAEIIGVSAVGEESLATMTITEAGSYLLTATNVTSPFKLTMHTSAKRAYVSTVKVADGRYTLSDLAGADAVVVTPVQTVVTTYTVNDAFELQLNDLEQQHYSYRVQAVDATGTLSEWSNTIEVLLPTPIETGVECISDIAMTDRLQVYSLSGVLLKSGVTSSSWSQGLPHGTYILRSGRQVRKVVR